MSCPPTPPEPDLLVLLLWLHTNRPTVRWVIVRHTSTDPIELERAKALREQSRNIRFHKGSVTL